MKLVIPNPDIPHTYVDYVLQHSQIATFLEYNFKKHMGLVHYWAISGVLGIATHFVHILLSIKYNVTAEVTKKFSEQNQVHVGMEPSKTNQTRWERHYNTFTPSLHLVPFCQLCLVFVSYVHQRVVEGSGMGSAGCLVHVDEHGE